MSSMRERAIEHFPAVLLTLISIIQALALELLWSKVLESEFLWSFDTKALLGWGMISVGLLGILQIWVMYSSMVMGFRWIPSLRDSIFPFIIGIQEFMLVSLISENFVASWLYVLASVFVTGNIITHLSFRRARQEPANEPFFRNRQPATWKDFKLAYIYVISLTLLGILTGFFSDSTLIPMLAICLANIFLIIQIVVFRRLWHTIINLPPDQ
jgi:hypothetical protein